MIKIKSSAEIGAKYASVTPSRTQQYKEGVMDPTVDWEGPTAAASDIYATAIQTAIAEGRFGRGVHRAGNPNWRRGAAGKGVARWGQGVREAGPAFVQGFGPYREVIANLDLPPRGAAGDPANIQRVVVVNEALHAKKLELKRAGG